MTVRTDYSPSSEQSRMIAALSIMPLAARESTVIELIESRGPEYVANLFAHVIGMANSVAENAREWLAVEMIVRCDLHPHQAEQINTPSMVGAALGAEKAAQVAQDGLCSGCALRRGTLANQCEPTQDDVNYIKRGSDRRGFLCHLDGLENCEPRKPCVGWVRWQALMTHAGATR